MTAGAARRHRFHGGPSTLIMGVLNVTPDSFSDGGQFFDADTATEHGLELVAAGASIVDVGGESTRPGAEPVGRDEEARRVLPVIRALAERGVQVSVDTIHAETARAAVEAGAKYINDVSGGTHDPEMFDTAAWASRTRGAAMIIGHWRGIPDPLNSRSDYTDVVAEVHAALTEQAEQAIAHGVAPEHIILDPGLGFDKTGAQGWNLLAQLHELAARGFPVLVGASRKRMLGEVIERLPNPSGDRVVSGVVSTHERDLATAVVSALAAQAGAWGVRVHDVVGTAQALAVEDAWDRAAVVAPRIPEDRIVLTGLEVFAHHGVFDFERERGQRFIIDADVAVDLGGAASTDALARTVHYGELAEAIVAAVSSDPVDLIETVAERVADVALGFEGVSEARITVHKPDAPIDAVFGDVSVSVVRRPDYTAAQRAGDTSAGDSTSADAPEGTS